MEDSWFNAFIKSALSELKHKGKTFVYTYVQRDELLKRVPGSVATYDEKYGCYWITLERKVKTSGK